MEFPGYRLRYPSAKKLRGSTVPATGGLWPARLQNVRKLSVNSNATPGITTSFAETDKGFPSKTGAAPALSRLSAEK
jgi:hypothetical protein